MEHAPAARLRQLWAVAKRGIRYRCKTPRSAEVPYTSSEDISKNPKEFKLRLLMSNKINIEINGTLPGAAAPDRGVSQPALLPRGAAANPTQ
jgi:hypothetical protein